MKFTTIIISVLSFITVSLGEPTPKVYDSNLNPLYHVSRAVPLDHSSIVKRLDGLAVRNGTLLALVMLMRSSLLTRTVLDDGTECDCVDCCLSGCSTCTCIFDDSGRLGFVSSCCPIC